MFVSYWIKQCSTVLEKLLNVLSLSSELNVVAFFFDQRKLPTGHSHPLVCTQKQWQISHSPLLLAVFEQAAVQQQESCPASKNLLSELLSLSTRKLCMVIFLLSFVKGSKSASGYGPGGPYLPADLYQGVHIRSRIWTGESNSRGVQIR